MKGPTISDAVLKALSAALRNPVVAQGVEEYLKGRQAELESNVNKAARLSLFDEAAKPAALQNIGALGEVNRIIEIINRFTKE